MIIWPFQSQKMAWRRATNEQPWTQTAYRQNPAMRYIPNEIEMSGRKPIEWPQPNQEKFYCRLHAPPCICIKSERFRVEGCT
jgi:hypothetical protein